MIWEYADCERALAELMPRTKKYDWAFRILRQAQIHGEGFAHRREQFLKRFVSRRKPFYIFETADGLKLLGDYRDRYSRHASLYPDEESFLAAHIIKALEEHPGAYVDVGSNMGILASTVARACPDHPVIAIEPEPGTARRAAATFALNKLKNVRVIQAACSDTDGEVTFYSPRGKSESASIVPLKGKKVDKVTVPMIRVDSLSSIFKYSKRGEFKVGCIKFDVEGHEPAALRGAIETIREHRPVVIFEYHWDIAPAQGWTAEDLVKELDGYDFEVLHEGKPPMPFPPTREMGTVLNVICRPR